MVGGYCNIFAIQSCQRNVSVGCTVEHLEQTEQNKYADTEDLLSLDNLAQKAASSVDDYTIPAINGGNYQQGMIALDPSAFSVRWYIDILHNGMIDPVAVIGWWSDLWNNSQWIRSIKNSFIIGILATLLATGLGTLAAIGLSRSEMPFRRPIMALLISPMIVPLVIIGSGMFFFFSDIGIAKTYVGVIVAHAILGTPYVIITVTATLVGFDQSLTRAAASLGANPFRTFFKVQMPLILPGVVSGALFAFITSFDEVVVILQVADVRQRTIPRQMFSGIREQISPTILAVATLLVIISIILLTVVELLRRRSERLRGITN